MACGLVALVLAGLAVVLYRRHRTRRAKFAILDNEFRDLALSSNGLAADRDQDEDGDAGAGAGAGAGSAPGHVDSDDDDLLALGEDWEARYKVEDQVPLLPPNRPEL